MIFVLGPFSGVGGDVVPVQEEVGFIPQNVVIISPLPELRAAVPVGEAFEGRDHPWNRHICRGRRPRRPLVYQKEEMYMVGHDDRMLHRHPGIIPPQITDIPIDHLPRSGQNRLWGVEDAAPYNNGAQQRRAVFGTKSDEIPISAPFAITL